MNTNRLDMITNIATMYYEENKTQTYIANSLGLSRPTVAQMLQEARDIGIVKISVVKKTNSSKDLSETIKEKYRLKNIFVAPQDATNPKYEIGVICADYIENKKNENLKIGIGFGSTVHEFIKNANYLNTNFDIITPLIGGVDLKNEALHSNYMCFQLANKYSCGVSFFYAPVMADTIEQKEAFIKSSLVQSSLEKAKCVDVAIFGVGNPLIDSAFQRLYYISEDDAQVLKDKNVVGDIASTFFNNKAESVNTPASNKFIGLTLSDLEKINDVVVLASGSHKKFAINALLNKKIINTLIIDYELAEALEKL